MIADLTGLDIANASLLDEGTAAAEAMAMAHRLAGNGKNSLLRRCRLPSANHRRGANARRAARLEHHCRRSAERRSIRRRCSARCCNIPARPAKSATSRPRSRALHAAGALAIMAADPLALTLLKSPGELGADIAIGSTQRFGVPVGYGGPHAAYIATKDDYKRTLPGRIVGVSVDSRGRPGLSPRLADARAAYPARESDVATSAPRRCCWRLSPRCTASITAPTD